MAEVRPTKKFEQRGLLKVTPIEKNPLATKLMNMAGEQLCKLCEGKKRGLLELIAGLG